MECTAHSWGGVVPAFPHLPKPSWGQGVRLGVGAEETRGHFLSGRLCWPDKCPQALGDPREGASGSCWLPKGLGQTPPLSLPGVPEPLLPTSQGLLQSCSLNGGSRPPARQCVLESPQLFGPPWAGSGLLEKLVLWVGKTEMLPMAWSQPRGLPGGGFLEGVGLPA